MGKYTKGNPGAIVLIGCSNPNCHNRGFGFWNRKIGSFPNSSEKERKTRQESVQFPLNQFSARNARPTYRSQMFLVFHILGCGRNPLIFQKRSPAPLSRSSERLLSKSETKRKTKMLRPFEALLHPCTQVIMQEECSRMIYLDHLLQIN